MQREVGSLQATDWARSGHAGDVADSKTVGMAELRAELARIYRDGLPATQDSAGDVLPNLRCVIARSIEPGSRLSRLATLNQLLEELLGGLDPAALKLTGDLRGDSREATRILFALESRYRGMTLTRRREQAAQVMGYEPHHFRKRIEPKLLAHVTDVLYAVNLKYRSRARIGPPSEISGDTPKLGPEDYTAHEEALSRLWSLVYRYRAELIAMGRARAKAEDGQNNPAEAEQGIPGGGRHRLLGLRPFAGCHCGVPRGVR